MNRKKFPLNPMEPYIAHRANGFDWPILGKSADLPQIPKSLPLLQ